MTNQKYPGYAEPYFRGTMMPTYGKDYYGGPVVGNAAVSGGQLAAVHPKGVNIKRTRAGILDTKTYKVWDNLAMSLPWYSWWDQTVSTPITIPIDPSQLVVNSATFTVAVNSTGAGGWYLHVIVNGTEKALLYPGNTTAVVDIKNNLHNGDNIFTANLHFGGGVSDCNITVTGDLTLVYTCVAANCSAPPVSNCASTDYMCQFMEWFKANSTLVIVAGAGLTAAGIVAVALARRKIGNQGYYR
jgi:hypothetical protein